MVAAMRAYHAIGFTASCTRTTFRNSTVKRAGTVTRCWADSSPPDTYGGLCKRCNDRGRTTADESSCHPLLCSGWPGRRSCRQPGGLCDRGCKCAGSLDRSSSSKCIGTVIGSTDAVVSCSNGRLSKVLDRAFTVLYTLLEELYRAFAVKPFTYRRLKPYFCGIVIIYI